MGEVEVAVHRRRQRVVAWVLAALSVAVVMLTVAVVGLVIHVASHSHAAAATTPAAAAHTLSEADVAATNGTATCGGNAALATNSTSQTNATIPTNATAQANAASAGSCANASVVVTEVHHHHYYHAPHAPNSSSSNTSAAAARPHTASMVVAIQSATGVVTATDGSSGEVVASSQNASQVINAAVAALGRPGGGTVVLRRGVYNLSAPISIERHSVELRGENGGGDSFFTADAAYAGFHNKMATVLVALDGVDAIQIGMTTFVLGTCIRDMGITGLAADESQHLPPDAAIAAGAGIRARRADTLRIVGVQVNRKHYGLALGPVGPFAWDNVVDVVTIQTFMASYCGFGVFAEGWVANVRITGLFGYINQWGLLHKSGTIGQYDWVVEGVTSQADAWHEATVPVGYQAAPLYLATAQELAVSNVVVEALKGSTLAAVPLLRLVLSRAGTAGDEWYRGHIRLDHVSAFSTAADAIRVVGEGMVDMRDCHIGSTGSQAFTGGDGRIMNHIVRSYGPDVDISITGGFVRSELADPATWFLGVARIHAVRGFNPVGAVAAPFYDSPSPALSPAWLTSATAGAAHPSPGTAYAVYGAPALLAVDTAALDAAHLDPPLVTLRDPTGATVVANASTARLAPLRLPLGFRVLFHAANRTALHAVRVFVE